MLISYKLLQTYFMKPLPKPEVLARALTFHAFEIEGMEKRGTDTVIDVKVLPDRAHDCLSHHGIAQEVGAVLDIPLEPLPKAKFPKPDAKVPTLAVALKDKRALRYIALVIDGVSVGESPKWLREQLATLGQRSVNNVVDATNYVMFMLGQPLHAFDYAKLSGARIVVRPGAAGEKMTTLDGKEVALGPETMVIADGKDVLALAGIKGGMKAEVTAQTTTIVLESANFDASQVRMTAQRLGIRTDASKRFESGMTPYLAEDALKLVSHLIVDIASGGEVRVGKPIDKFPKKPKAASVAVTLYDINHILGTTLTDRDVTKIWKRLGHVVKKKGSGYLVSYTVAVPHERLDLRIKEDLVEEIGRIAGYESLASTMPAEWLRAPQVNKEWVCRDIARGVMLGAGFSEVYTYTFLGQGEIEVANPIASDKKYLRNNLMNGLKQAVSENLKHESAVRIFEFGHIFGKDKGNLREENSFAALMGFAKRKEVEMKADFYYLKGALDTVFDALGISGVRYEEASGELVASVFAGKVLLGMMSINGFELNFAKMAELANAHLRYKEPSRYPSIIRDVSLFVPLQTKAGDVETVIRNSAGVLLRGLALFDVFEQPDKKSLAYRMVLQSDERTLSDQEANAVYDRVVDALRQADVAWQVRV